MFWRQSFQTFTEEEHRLHSAQQMCGSMKGAYVLHRLVVSDCHVAQSYSLYQKPPLRSENMSILVDTGQRIA